MKVLALGGYGTYGLPAVKLLANYSIVSRIALAGRDLRHAQDACGAIGRKAIAVEVDGRFEEQLVSVLRGYDLLMETASVETLLPALRASIRCGVPFCGMSIRGSTGDQALQLDADARAAGVTAILGCGEQPGLSNLMAVRVAGELADVQQIVSGWPFVWRERAHFELKPQQWLSDPQESLVVLRGFAEFLEGMLTRRGRFKRTTVRTFREGRWTDIDPVREGLLLPLPSGDSVRVYPYGSSPPGNQWWLPQHQCKLPPVQLWFTPFPPELHHLLRHQAQLVGEGKVDAASALAAFFGTVENEPERWLVSRETSSAPPVFWVAATGQKEGRAARQVCRLTSAMWAEENHFYVAAVPLVVATINMLRGNVPKPGVMTAESTFAPQQFLSMQYAGFFLILPALVARRTLSGCCSSCKMPFSRCLFALLRL